MNKGLERANGAWWLPRATTNRSDASLPRRALLTGAVLVAEGTLVTPLAPAQSVVPAPQNLAPPLFARTSA